MEERSNDITLRVARLAALCCSLAAALYAATQIEPTPVVALGMSGGPLLDEDGAVAGINHKGGPGEARDFAVHYKALTDWLSGS